ncbi:MAG: diguanylate cyclase/phosphodiesterase (GGDEF & EAL domains) with PAS/PAC sensor(s) [Nitrospira sp.]|nr:MAG: diguanylate cyclase/phosphodiesterase (GGDEF & EAL domains) with PAS/PAC sensor(s) [Nitrospira sp.]
MHADDKAQVLAAVAAALDGRTPYSVECRIIRPTGEVRHVHCRGMVIRDSDGRPMKMAGTVLDVTERKQAEQARRRLEFAVDHSMEGLALLDESGRFVYMNDAHAQIYGYSAPELLGKSWKLLYDREHAAYIEQQCVPALSGKPFWQGELVGRRQDGTAFDVEVSLRILPEGAEERGLLICTCRDISERRRMEVGLQQSEERFRQLAEHINAVFWLVTADKTNLIYVSPAFDSIWGRPRRDLYESPEIWMACVHPDDRNRVETAAACQATLLYDEEYRIVRPDGSIRWIRDRCFPIRDASGNVYRFAGIAEDITATKRMAEALRNSEARYRSLVELSPNAVLVTCDGIIVYANQACLNLVRASAPSELLKRDFFSLVPPESRPRFQARLADLTATGEALPSMEERFVRLDGTVIDIEIAAAPITFEGRPAIQRIVTDVTTRKYLEQALLSANRQLTAILDAATRFSVIATDTTGMMTTFNKGAEELLGYSAEELLGKHSLNILHLPAEVEQRSRQLTELYGRPVHGFAVFVEHAKQGGYDEREWTYRRKDGSHLTVSVTVTALRNENGGIVGFLAVGKDVTRRKEAEAALARAARELEQKNIELAQARDEALRAVRLKADFLATMSHEIRTPMNAIIGMTGLLLETTLTEDQREFANTVRSSGDALLTLVNDILDFSKIEAGKLHFEEIAFELRTTVEDVLDLLAEQAQGKGLELIGLVDAAVPTCVLGDPGRLRQILVNLVGNAIKFTSAGEVFLHVTRDEQDGSDLLRFTITDTGIGIPQEAQTRLFEAFVQADSSTTRRYGGTGLGLAICERLVTQMQGRIGIESRPGQGSTFWFTARLPKPAVTAPLPTISRRRLLGQRILLVAQNHRVRSALHQQLAAHGMDCACAANGTQAVEMAHVAAALRRPFGLALIELHLPEMDGFETAALLKQDRTTAALRLVILTPVGRRGADARAQAIGIDAYLTKPLRQTQLLDCLCLLLGNPITAGAPDVTDTPPLMTRQTPIEAQPSPTARLLLVEDNLVNQKVAIKMLEKLGYRVDVAGNGQEAVAAHERSPYPLIFMDCQMPEMDGFEATRLIREREAGLVKREAFDPLTRDGSRATNDAPRPAGRIPIIAMTANALQGDRERCLAAGMDDYVAKPIRSKDLQAIIETWLLRRPKAANS